MDEQKLEEHAVFKLAQFHPLTVIAQLTASPGH